MKWINTTTISAMTTNSGKTTFTLGLLFLLQKMGKVCSCKVGPDFIDPMFHNVVLSNTLTNHREESLMLPGGSGSFLQKDPEPSIYNLDSFFESEQALNRRFSNAVQDTEYVIVEGVMGHLDGLKGGWTSTDEVAAITKSPVTLLVEERPSIRTLAAMVDGVIKNSRSIISSVVITKSSSDKLFQMQKEEIEALTGISVAGRLPYDEGLKIPSRHLGLNTDMIKLSDELLAISERCARLINDHINLNTIFNEIEINTAATPILHKKTKRAAISRDEAFCFMYRANIEWLEENGYDIVYFSPMRDKFLPEADFYYLCGGYPEIYLKGLSENVPMRRAIKEVCGSEIPVLAECGGFMYLHDSIEDHPMTGYFKGNAKIGRRMNRRFGYEYLSLPDEFIFENRELRGHEFHYGYIESGEDENGMMVRRASNGMEFLSGHYENNTLGSFSHLYFPSLKRDLLQE